MTWLNPEDVRLDDLLTVLKERTDAADYPHAELIEQQVPVYDAARIRTHGLCRPSSPVRSVPGLASSS
jgi:hypothetical protein